MVEYRKATPEDANSCVKILRHWIDETSWMPILHSERSMQQFWRGRLGSGPINPAPLALFPRNISGLGRAVNSGSVFKRPGPLR